VDHRRRRDKANAWQHSVGWTRDEDFWCNLAKVPEKVWTPALDAKGTPREDAALVEITDMLDLEGWPEGLRIIVRREPVHPKYARDLKPYEVATGFRYQAIVTNTPGVSCSGSTPATAFTPTSSPGSAGQKHSHSPGCHRASSQLNQAWCTLLAIAMDLLARLQLLALDGRLARAEPATLRTDLFDIPAKLTHHARRRELKFDPAWPASHNTVTAWDRVQALPDPG
jgi:hypothetical protein